MWLSDLMPLFISVLWILVEQMGNVWFCCWNANRVCNGLGLCWSSKDTSVQFRDIRSGISRRLISEPWIPFDLNNCHLGPQSHLYVLISVIAVACTMFCNFFSYYIPFTSSKLSQFTWFARIKVYFCHYLNQELKGNGIISTCIRCWKAIENH